MMVPDAVYCPENGHSVATQSSAPGNASVPRSSVESRYSVNHRALLFGSRFGPGKEMNRKSLQAAEMSRAQVQDLLREQNDKLVEGLEVQTVALKQVALDIRHETAQSNMLVDKMGKHFEGAQHLLTKSQEQLHRISKQANNAHVCYMVGFALVLLLILYFLSGHRGQAATSAFLK